MVILNTLPCKVEPACGEGAIMESRQAAAQIDFIWAQVVRTECFRGYRPATVAVTGLLGLFAALAQSHLVPEPARDAERYVSLWASVAVASLSISLLEVGLSYLRSESQIERRLTRRALQQFLPCLVAGAFLTLVIAEHDRGRIVLLPGLWALCFGMGIFASVPFVTPAVGWIGLYYFAAGGLALWYADGALALSPLLMGSTFGVGQLLMATVLQFAEVKRDVEA
jgi:hypothetical protein